MIHERSFRLFRLDVTSLPTEESMQIPMSGPQPAQTDQRTNQKDHRRDQLPAVVDPSGLLAEHGKSLAVLFIGVPVEVANSAGEVPPHCLANSVQPFHVQATAFVMVQACEKTVDPGRAKQHAGKTRQITPRAPQPQSQNARQQHRSRDRLSLQSVVAGLPGILLVKGEKNPQGILITFRTHGGCVPHPGIALNAKVPRGFLDHKTAYRQGSDLTRSATQARSEVMAEETPLREYDADTRDEVRETYRKNHTRQTLALAQDKAARFGKLDRARMTIWEALVELDRVIDESDPDTELSQLQHALQTAESLRVAGAPPWMQLVGLIHDAGKMLCLFGEEQWAVVGDTYPLGCAFSDSIVFHELFAENPDRSHADYKSETGIYQRGCGLDAVTMSWGHDEYLYQVTRGRLPAEAAFVIRFHSFYPLHQENAYRWMLNEEDEAMLPWLGRFQKHDLYSKTHQPPDFDALSARYRKLAESFLPDTLDW